MLLRSFLTSLLMLVACVANAASPALRQQMMQPPGWVNHNTYPAVDEDFNNKRFWTTWGYTGPQVLNSISRASNEAYTDLSGNLSFIGSNALAVGSAGLQVWELRTNVALQSSDLTQATWAATNVTAAKNSIGPDNVSNSASSITSTAINGSILQSITLASQSDTYSVYVLCVTCTGTVRIAEYPSGTPAFTALSSGNCKNSAGVGTAPNTSTWVRCVGTATVLNPVIGFQFDNSGDTVDVYCNQLEAGGFATPCIPTTTTSVTRAADNITATGALATIINGLQGTIRAQTNGLNNIGQIIQGNATSSVALYFTGSVTAATAHAFNGTTDLGSSNTANIGNAITSAVGWQNGTPTEIALSGTATVAGSNFTYTQGTVGYVGQNKSNSALLNGNITRLTAWSSKLTQGALTQ